MIYLFLPNKGSEFSCFPGNGIQKMQYLVNTEDKNFPDKLEQFIPILECGIDRQDLLFKFWCFSNLPLFQTSFHFIFAFSYLCLFQNRKFWMNITTYLLIPKVSVWKVIYILTATFIMQIRNITYTHNYTFNELRSNID